MHFYYLAMLFSTIVVPLIAKVLKALGIGAVVYVGINIMLDQAIAYIQSQMGQSTALLQSMLGVARIDIAINIIFAAVTTRFVMQGMNSLTGTKKQYTFKA